MSLSLLLKVLKDGSYIEGHTFSWLGNDRRLCRNYELLLENSENMVKLSAIKLLLNKIEQALNTVFLS